MKNISANMTIPELIERLERMAPKSCSKPKSEMCSKCIDRTTTDNALVINDYLLKLKNVRNNKEQQAEEIVAEATSFLMNAESAD